MPTSAAFTPEQLAQVIAIISQVNAAPQAVVTTAAAPAPVEIKKPTASEVAAEKSVSARIGKYIGKVEVNVVPNVARAAGWSLTRSGSVVEKIGQIMQASGEVCYAYADTHMPAAKVEHKAEVINMFPELVKKYNDPKISNDAKDMIAQLANVKFARLQAKIKAAAEAAKK
jgi:hypothetical protein